MVWSTSPAAVPSSRSTNRSVTESGGTRLEAQSKISAPSIANGIVYVGGVALYALNAVDGHVVWRNRRAGVNVSTPAIAESRVFVNAEDPQFGSWAFDAQNGAFLWRSEMLGQSE